MEAGVCLQGMRQKGLHAPESTGPCSASVLTFSVLSHNNVTSGISTNYKSTPHLSECFLYIDQFNRHNNPF